MSWTPIKTAEGRLSTFERKILREICGPGCVNYVWRIKSNELYSLYKEPSIVKMIKIAKIERLGYIARTENNGPCMKITFSQPGISRQNGRPRLRWLDLVLKHLQTLEMNT